MPHIRKFTNLLPHQVRFNLRRIIFWGHTHKCVLCTNGIRSFRSHGGGAAVLDARRVVGGMRREADSCPVCHGRDRTRLMMLYLEQHTKVGRTPLRLLHVAPDYGLYLWLKRQHGLDYVGTDIDTHRYRHIEGIQTADLTATGFPDDSFDVIVCSHVLEHVPNDRAAFLEISRILKPGGIALLLTPYALDGKGTDEDPTVVDPKGREQRFGQWDHLRLYDRDTFLDRMHSAGLDVQLYNPFDENHQQADMLHLNPLELLPIGHKPLGIQGG